MQHGTGADVTVDRLGERGEQEHHLAHPVSECRAVELDALARVDGALTVQRKVIAELRHRDAGEQAGAWAPALDGQGGHWRLHDRLADTAAQLGADVLDHLEAGGDVFEHLAFVLADPAEHFAAAAGAGAGGLVGDDLARQMVRLYRTRFLGHKTRLSGDPEIGLVPGGSGC